MGGRSHHVFEIFAVCVRGDAGLVARHVVNEKVKVCEMFEKIGYFKKKIKCEISPFPSFFICFHLFPSIFSISHYNR